jgi:hypothetical protein
MQKKKSKSVLGKLGWQELFNGDEMTCSVRLAQKFHFLDNGLNGNWTS